MNGENNTHPLLHALLCHDDLHFAEVSVGSFKKSAFQGRLGGAVG